MRIDAISRCAIVQDPWGSRLLLLDHRNGRLLTDPTGPVRTDAAGKPMLQGDPPLKTPS